MAFELAQLAEVRAARTRLDEQELIERARHEGATWTQIAAAHRPGSKITLTGELSAFQRESHR